MKLKTIQILINFILFVILISESFGDKVDLTRTLNDQFEYILNGKDDIELFRSINTDCVKEFLNLTENGENLVDLPQEFVLLMSSFLQCSELGEAGYLELYLKSFVPRNNPRLTDCFKLQLKILEPTSKLVDNFLKNLAGNELEYCKNNKINQKMKDFVSSIESAVGPLATFTCGAVKSYKELTKFYYESYLILNEEDKEMRESEMKSLTEYFRDVLHKTVECIMRDIEKSNLADGPNSKYRKPTISLLFDQKLQQISQIDNDTNLSELYDSIDFVCVKSNLNLSKIGGKFLYEVEGTFIISSAKLKCLKISSTEFAFLFARIYASEGFSSEKYQELENIRADLSHKFRNLRESICGAIRSSDLENHFFEAFVILSEEGEELRTKAMTELSNIVTQKIHKAADCFTERLN